MKIAALARLCLALAALAVLVLSIALCAGLRDRAPSGLLFEANSGWVTLVQSGSAADQAGLRPGDTITAIGGLSTGGDATAIGGLLPVSVRQGNLIGVYWLQQPAAGIPWSLAVLLVVAGALWLSGLLVGLLRPAQAAARWFASFALLAALALCCAAAQDPPQHAAQWLLAPVTFAALTSYMWLQGALCAPTLRRSSLSAYLALSAQAVLLVLAIELGPRIFGAGSGHALAIIGSLDMLVLLVAAHILPIRQLGGEPAAPVRRRVRLGLLVGLVSWLPALVLGWAPILAGLFGAAHVAPLPPHVGALSLLVLAVTYPAIVTRGDLLALDVAVRRLAVSLITAGVLLALAAAIVHGVDVAFHPAHDARLALGVALALLAVPTFDPARRRLLGTLDRRLTTEQPDYSPALETLGAALLEALDEAAIAEVLTGMAPPLLGVTGMHVWLLGADGRWLFYTGRHPVDRSFDPLLIPASVDDPFIPVLNGGAPAGQPPLLPSALLRSDQPFVPPTEAAVLGIDLCVPTHLDERLRGLLLLGPRRSQDPYRRPERDALVLLGRQVAAALQLVDRLAELRARNGELAQLTSRLARAREEERKHLSHELHDEVAQDLVVITRQLRRHLQTPLSDALWQEMLAQSQEALTAIRRICNDLRPAILDMGLASALRELVDHAPQSAPPLRVRLDLLGPEQRLDEEREFALYRITQEALTNVIKHAHASEVAITVRFTPATVEITVRDNGHGFAVPPRLEEIGGDHLGLLGMRERLASLGGTLNVESAPGAGTTVCAQLPVG